MAAEGATTSERIRDLLLPATMVRGAVLLGVLAGLFFISTVNFLLFHGIAELAGLAVAFSIFIIVWNTRRVIPDTFFLIVGISFLFFGGIDLVHTLAYKGMGIFPGDNADLPTQLWIAARYFQSIALLAATFFIGRSITDYRKHDVGIILATCTAACTLLFASIFVWQDFPHAFIEGSGLTSFKIASEYIIAFIFVVTIAVLFHKREYFDPAVWRLLIAAQVFVILGELSFTSYVSVFGFMNVLGHLFRLVSIYLFYQVFIVIGLSRPYDLLLRDLKINEDRLQESEKKYRTLFENMLEGFVYCRILYDEECRLADWVYLDVNKAFGKLTGLENITGKLGLEVIPDIRKQTPELFNTYGRVASTGISETLEIDFKPKKLLKVSVFSPEKGYFVAVFEDITERKRADEALRQVNTKLNLLSNITRHDINNQLLALKAYLELSKETLGDAAKMSEYIIREERAANAIERQIIFTKEYQDLGVKAPVWQRVDASITKALNVLPLRDVRIAAELKDLEVYADPLFEKVFYNLIDNALRYGGQGMTRIRITPRESETGLVISVEDDGTGISATDKGRLFERGFGHHTGLGLFLSREILAITGITITETGEPGKGARFEILVPKSGYRYPAPG
jgi:PAS domain S-box-containing protein